MSEEKKRRAPAFPLYVDDFIGGTVDLSQDEVGARVAGSCGGEVLAQLRDGGGGATGR